MKLWLAVACFVLVVLGFVSAFEETPSFILSENEAEAFQTSEISTGSTVCVGAGYVCLQIFIIS